MGHDIVDQAAVAPRCKLAGFSVVSLVTPGWQQQFALVKARELMLTG